MLGIYVNELIKWGENIKGSGGINIKIEMENVFGDRLKLQNGQCF